MPRKILIVDQSASIRRILRTMILANINDAEISEAENSSSATDFLATDPQHIVLFSWESSSEQWLRFVKQTKADPDNHRLNFILFTSSPDDERFDKARQSGVAHRLITPCSPETLTDLINRACNPALLRHTRRYNVPDSVANLAQGVACLDATIINISMGGMLCEIPLTEELDWTVPLLASVTFPAADNGQPVAVANLFSVISSFFVQKRNSDFTPKTIRISMRFLNLPPDAEAKLSSVFSQAEKQEKGLGDQAGEADRLTSI